MKYDVVHVKLGRVQAAITSLVSNLSKKFWPLKFATFVYYRETLLYVHTS